MTATYKAKAVDKNCLRKKSYQKRGDCVQRDGIALRHLVHSHVL